jgi:putative ABC transport system permease protein
MKTTGLGRDLILALRQLGVRPGFALLVVLTLGSAIGVNASLFTVFNTVVYQPWPVRDPARVRHVMPAERDGRGMSIAEWRHVAGQARSFAGMAAMAYPKEVRIGEREGHVDFVSANFFDVLGISIEVGRGFLPQEEEPGRVAVLGYGAWQRHFGGDPGVVGRTISFDGMPFTVVGVATRRLLGTHARYATDAWLPFAARAAWHVDRADPRDYINDPRHCCVWVTARLAPGVSMETARTEVDALSRAFRAQAGLELGGFALRGTSRAETWENEGRGGRGAVGFVSRLWLLFLAVTLVLLLACANVGNLLLARGHARRQEIAIRLSLGATRPRIVRQLLVEAFVLSLLAGAVGVGIAAWLPELLVKSVPEGVHAIFSLDYRVFLYALAVASLTCVAVGLAPALHCTRAAVSGALKGTHDGVMGRLRLRSLLLGVQVAICVMLLTGAGLLTRGVQNAFRRDLGFDPAGVDVVQLAAPVRPKDDTRDRSFHTQLHAELAALPGTATARALPLAARGRVGYAIPNDPDDRPRGAVTLEVSPSYFDVLRIPLVAGRTFERSDPDDGVAIVSEELVARHWPGESPLGKRIIYKGSAPWREREIIGVARNAFTSDLSEFQPTIYLPLRPTATPFILVRKDKGNPAPAAAAIATRLDSQLRASVFPLEAHLSRRLNLTRLAANIAGSVGALALVLATTGLFGVFAYAVQQRTRELGIRIALGATTVHILRTVLAAGGGALLAGLGVGTALALGVSQVLRSVLYGLSPLDPVTYLVVFATLLAAGLAATYLPARRALRVDPTVALRQE